MGNAFYSYKKKKNAVLSHTVWFLTDCDIYECVIPKESKYIYKGLGNLQFPEYASQKLMLKRRLTKLERKWCEFRIRVSQWWKEVRQAPVCR